MALTDDNGMNYSMPVQPFSYGNGGGFGNGFGGDGAWFLLFLLLICGNNGWGNGFGGGFGGGNVGGDLYPWMNQSNQMNDGFRDQMLNSNITGIQNAVTSGFGDTALGIAGINQNICQTGNGIIGAVNGSTNAITGQMYANTIADLERSFASQTANTAGLTALQGQLASCCCDNRLATANLGADIAREACADRQAVSEALMGVTAQNTANTTALMNTITGGIQSIKDQLCADKIESKNDTIAQLRSELMYARGQASQDVQTAAIQAGQRALANEVEQYVAPKAVPAYVVQNPNCCGNYTGCGCGNF